MIIGYARVSTEDQKEDLQIDALEAAGADRIFKEKASGGRWDRPELHKMLDILREGDVVVVWKLDRLSRSLIDLLRVMASFNDLGVGFRSLTQPIDTTTPAGKMMMAIIGAFAEFERDMIRERTLAGLDAARARGVIGGRPRALTSEQEDEILVMLKNGRKQADLARIFEVSTSTVSRIAKKMDVPATMDSVSSVTESIKGEPVSHVYMLPPTEPEE